VEINPSSIANWLSEFSDYCPFARMREFAFKKNIRRETWPSKLLSPTDNYSRYYFHQAKLPDLLVKPFLDDVKHGVFATRAPRRPNGIGISVVKLRAIEGNILEVENLDILDGTPLLDIKPYVPDFDEQEEVRIGWLESSRGKINKKMSDDRFVRD